jgi:hypothetical protein
MPSTLESERDMGPPFWSMGLVVLIMLIIPMLLYSLSPSGPIREGDTIFSEGSTKVPLAYPSLYDRANFDGTCLLDPQDPLMVVQRPSDRSDGLILAKVQGKTRVEWPFCPPQAEVVVAPNQIAQKLDLLGEVSKRAAQWWSR